MWFQNRDMFLHTCTACSKRLLIFPSQVTELTNTPTGIVVAFTCWCGEAQSLRTGRRSHDHGHAAHAA